MAAPKGRPPNLRLKLSRRGGRQTRKEVFDCGRPGAQLKRVTLDGGSLPEDTLMPHGKICYLEIPANRAEDSARFYSDIFGWKVRERGDGNLAFDDTGGVSGTWVKEDDRTPDERTRTYIMVDSITESLKRIERAGGKVVTQRTDIGKDMGAFAAFTDPVGNEFGLYEEPKR